MRVLLCGWAVAVLLAGWCAAGPADFLHDDVAWERVQALIDDKAAKAQAVLDYIANRRKYPVPPNVIGFRPGTDVQKGQAELEALTALAIDAHNALELELLRLTKAAEIVDVPPTDVGLPAQFANQTMPPGFDPARLPAGDRTYVAGPTTRPAYAGAVARPPKAADAKIPMPADKATPIILYAIIESTPAWNDWLKRLADGGADDAPLPHALAALGRADYAEAEKRAEKLAGRELWFFDHMARHAVAAYNTRPRPGEGARPNLAELEVIESINAYRMALDLVPWAVDHRLQKAAILHSAYQVKTGKIGHEQADPRLRHSWQRARRQGYPAEDLSEIISNGLGPWTVWGWRADSEHHRSLVREHPRACGVGIEGQFVTCLSASHDESPFPRLLRPRPPKAKPTTRPGP